MSELSQILLGQGSELIGGKAGDTDVGELRVVFLVLTDDILPFAAIDGGHKSKHKCSLSYSYVCQVVTGN